MNAEAVPSSAALLYLAVARPSSLPSLLTPVVDPKSVHLEYVLSRHSSQPEQLLVELTKVVQHRCCFIEPISCKSCVSFHLA